MLQTDARRSFLEMLEARLSKEVQKDQLDARREGQSPPWLFLALANETLDLGLTQLLLKRPRSEAVAWLTKALEYLRGLIQMAVDGDRHARTWLVARDARLAIWIPLALGDGVTASASAALCQQLTIHRFKRAEALELALLGAAASGRGDEAGTLLADLQEALAPYEDGPPPGQELPGWRVEELRGWSAAWAGLFDGDAGAAEAGLERVLNVARGRAEERIDANVRKFFHTPACGFVRLAQTLGVSLALEAPEIHRDL